MTTETQAPLGTSNVPAQPAGANAEQAFRDFLAACKPGSHSEEVLRGLMAALSAGTHSEEALHGLMEPQAPSQLAKTLSEIRENATGRKTERLELRASQEFIEALDFLAKDEDLSRPDIIRRSVGLYARARMEMKRGRQLAIVEPVDNQIIVKDYIHL
jgi:hypothetical protein